MIDKPKIGFEVNISSSASKVLEESQPSPLETSPDSPFRIAVLGDFSGRCAGALPTEKSKAIAARPFVDVDRDNFEEVMSGYGIEINLDIGDESVQIGINELDDFHPNALYEKVETFSQLRSLRRRLKNNKTFAEAAAEIQGWLPDIKPETLNPDSNESVAVEVELATENLLDNILDAQQGQESDTGSVEAANIDKLVRNIVAPYVEPAADPRQDEMVAMVDSAIASHMREILHHTGFQAIESIWQSLYFLVKRLDTDSKLKIMLLDVSKSEFQSDLAVDDITVSDLYKKFCDPTAGDMPWSVILGSYTFTDSIDDVLSLVNIGTVAKLANAPFLAAANETLAGCESFSFTSDYDDWHYKISDGVAQAWQLLRQSPVSGYIGLALPRFLLRLPFGKKSKPIDAFPFEEMPDKHCHECYLWGNAAFIKVELLARNFKTNGWKMNPSAVHQTDHLPVHYYQEDGGTVVKPVAEILLTERGGEKLSDQGLMSLWSVRDMDSIRSVDFRSLSENGNKISGRWN